MLRAPQPQQKCKCDLVEFLLGSVKNSQSLIRIAHSSASENVWSTLGAMDDF